MGRRVVTGLDAEGRSCVVIDGPSDPATGFAWRTTSVPADNSRNEDTLPPAFDYDLFHDGGTNFFYVEMPPGTRSSLHATNTIDYLTIVSGEVVLELEAGEVRLGPGDLVIDRGVIHAWRNDGPAPCIYSCVTIPAHPVGNGRVTE